MLTITLNQQVSADEAEIHIYLIDKDPFFIPERNKLMRFMVLLIIRSWKGLPIATVPVPLP